MKLCFMCRLITVIHYWCTRMQRPIKLFEKPQHQPPFGHPGNIEPHFKKKGEKKAIGFLWTVSIVSSCWKWSELRAPITNKVSEKIKKEAMSNKDRENKETGERDLRKRITVASVWVAASASDLIGNDISFANAVFFFFFHSSMF